MTKLVHGEKEHSDWFPERSVFIWYIRTAKMGRSQPPPQDPLGGQNGGSEKTLANNRSRVSKNIGDFGCFKMAVGFIIG